ncbi:MAG: hypothetical protein JWN82_671 [Candidatus Saccharibacteria bacterium]|nr:hypothetical protein [Candidatus Saccharibacteria bacterium]
MDTALITLVAIVIVPVVALMLLRINAALVFMALCLGSVLTQFVAEDASWFVALAKPNVPQAGSVSESMVKLGLLLLPPLLTAVFMIRTVHGGGRLLLNALPAVGTGLLAALLVVPLLTPGTAIPILASPLWQDVVKLQDLIVGSSALLCLLVLWLQRPKTGERKHRKHHG